MRRNQPPLPAQRTRMAPRMVPTDGALNAVAAEDVLAWSAVHDADGVLWVVGTDVRVWALLTVGVWMHTYGADIFVFWESCEGDWLGVAGEEVLDGGFWDCV